MGPKKIFATPAHGSTPRYLPEAVWRWPGATRRLPLPKPQLSTPLGIKSEKSAEILLYPKNSSQAWWHIPTISAQRQGFKAFPYNIPSLKKV